MELKNRYLLLIITVLCAQNIFSQETSDSVIGEKLAKIGIKTAEAFAKTENKEKCIELIGEKTYLKALNDINE